MSTENVSEEKQLFTEWESDFYQYLSSPEGGVNKHSRTNYMSWMKFLSRHYSITSDIDEATIDAIIESERRHLSTRGIYNSTRDLTNFRSVLRKFRQFAHSDFSQVKEKLLQAEEEKVKNDTSIPITEREAIVKARVGQGVFRRRLIEHWRGCSVTGFGLYDVLMASHIKPWRVSTNEERLSVYNGLLLTPNYDKLFDKGYISFDRRGRIIFSSFFPAEERRIIGIGEDVVLTSLETEHLEFLKYHNNHCLMR